MYWMASPPYWRWLAAGAVIVIAAYMDLSGPATESYPFAAAVTEPGEVVELEWREIPAGVLGPPSDLSGVARARLEAGTPIVEGILAPIDAVPADWWALQADIPSQATIGSRVLVAIARPDSEVVGIVVAPSSATGFGGVTPGLLAIPPERAAEVAVALAEQRATLLIQSG